MLAETTPIYGVIALIGMVLIVVGFTMMSPKMRAKRMAKLHTRYAVADYSRLVVGAGIVCLVVGGSVVTGIVRWS
jgi:uncharacterized membrane protein